jgi:hypothetical protein
MSRKNPELLPALPNNRRDAEAARGRARKQVTKRAAISAVAAAVPVPGLDLAVDLATLTTMLHEVNAEFGLTPAQLERLTPKRRLTVFRALEVAGATMAGRVITRQLVLSLLKQVARRAATATVVRYVPFAGQAAAASMSFALIKLIGERHVAECMEVAERLAAGAAPD